MSTTTKTPDHDPANSLNVTVGDGKYTVIQDASGKMSALRYGEVWRDCCGDGLIYTLAAEVQRLREINQRLVSALTQLSECNLNDGNCAGFEVANRRIRNIAVAALQQYKTGSK